jgi:predicted RNA-binding protein with EMAP domain
MRDREERKMQVSYNLLKEYVDIDISAEELAQRLTINGIILERMENISTEIEKVVVGRITAIDQHPGNKTLSVCQVDIIICLSGRHKRGSTSNNLRGKKYEGF